jgi:hypothetical protein
MQAQNIPISTLRNSRHNDSSVNNDIPFVITHNPQNHNILETARRYFPIFEQSQNLRNLINESQIKTSKRQAPNLRRILTRARFTSENSKSVKNAGIHVAEHAVI